MGWSEPVLGTIPPVLGCSTSSSEGLPGLPDPWTPASWIGLDSVKQGMKTTSLFPNEMGGTAANRFLILTAHHFFSTAGNLKEIAHKYLEPNALIGSWEIPKTPKEGEKILARLRRDYAKQVKELRKEFVREIELIILEKKRKEAARKEAIRVTNEKRKSLKAEAAKIKEQQRKIADEELRQILLKERAERLEIWRMKEIERKEKEKNRYELLRRQSSVWIDEFELEKKILEALLDATPL